MCCIKQIHILHILLLSVLANGLLLKLQHISLRIVIVLIGNTSNSIKTVYSLSNIFSVETLIYKGHFPLNLSISADYINIKINI